MEDLIEEMRDALITWEKRSFDLGQIPHLTMRQRINEWQKMERSLVNKWFDKFFVFRETDLKKNKSEPHSLNPHPEKDHDGW